MLAGFQRPDDVIQRSAFLSRRLIANLAEQVFIIKVSTLTAGHAVDHATFTQIFLDLLFQLRSDLGFSGNGFHG